MMRPRVVPCTHQLRCLRFGCRVQVSRRVVRDVNERLTKAVQYTYTGGWPLRTFCMQSLGSGRGVVLE